MHPFDTDKRERWKAELLPFAKAFRDARKAAGKTQGDVSYSVNLSVSQLSNVERAISPPNVELMTYAISLGVDLNEAFKPDYELTQ